LGKPVFRLESVLRYRQGIEDQEMIKMLKASQVVKEQEEAADQLKREKQRHYEDYQSRSISLTDLMQREVYIDQLNQRLARQTERVEQARQQLEVQRSSVVEASTRKKTLERLKEKHLEELQMQVSKTEQQILDDIGVTAYFHRANQ